MNLARHTIGAELLFCQNANSKVVRKCRVCGLTFGRDPKYDIVMAANPLNIITGVPPDQLIPTMLYDAIKTLKLAQCLENRNDEQRRNLMTALIQEGRAQTRQVDPETEGDRLSLEIDGIRVEGLFRDQLIKKWRIAALNACS